MARLDRLGPAKQVAQLAACLGREFGHEMLAAVADQDDGRLGAALDALAASGLLMRDGERPGATYAFRHALVQEAAYSSLLRARRQELHARIAATVEARFPDVVGLRPEWLAHHYAEAGQTEPAAELWLRAAQRSKDAHANQEARSHLGRCLGLIERSSARGWCGCPGADRARAARLWSCWATSRALKAISRRPTAATSRPWRSHPMPATGAASSVSDIGLGLPSATERGSPSTSTGEAPRRWSSSPRSPTGWRCSSRSWSRSARSSGWSRSTRGVRAPPTRWYGPTR